MITTDTTYNTLIASGSYEESITGTLKDGSGTTVLNISNEYIKTGSLIIDNKCINNDDLEPGAVYAAELKITITGNAGLTSAQKSSLQNGSLNLTYTITDGNSSSSISIGIYYIVEVTLKDEDVEIIAEDMMSRLSKNIPTAVREDLNFVARTPYELLDLCCQNCSTSRRPISLVNDETEFDTWCNADASFLIPTTADIATYRDLVAEVAKIMGCFATIDKSTNGLILKRLNPHSNSNVWTLNEDIRYSTEKSGYVCLFGKVALGSVSYPTTSDDDVSGLILSMRASELTDDSEVLPGIVQNLYTELSDISYRPCKIEFMGNIALEVGDWIGVNYTEDNTTYTFRTIITHFTWILNGKELIESTGSSAATTKKVGSKGSGESRNSSSIDNLESRIETLESAQGDGGNKVYISELAPTVADNAIGNEGDLWYKVKRKGHFEGAVLKCIRAGKMTEPNMEFSVGQYVRINYGNYYNSNDPYLKGWGPTNWSGWKDYEFISLSNMEGINERLSIWGNFPGYYPGLYGNQSLRLWTCNYDEERMITSNEVAVGGFGRTAVGYDIGYQGKNYWGWSTISIGGILNNIEYNAEESDEHMVDPAAVKAVVDGLALFEIVDWGEGTNYGYDGTIIERMTLERYVKYDGVWVTADYKAGKGIIIADGEIRINTSTSVNIIQNVTSGTQLATINDTPIYAPTPQSVSVTQTQTSGTEIGSITIDNNTTKLYAPSGGGSDVTVTPITTTGTNIANIAVNGTTYSLFAPTSGGGSHNYSTTEQVVGTWIDGSTVYEKTQYGGITFSTKDAWYDTDITNIDKVVSVQGSINRGGEVINIGYWYSTIASRWILRNHTLKVSMTAMASGETYTLNSITVQYTKTS